jgi:hypothetical protein
VVRMPFGVPPVFDYPPVGQWLPGVDVSPSVDASVPSQPGIRITYWTQSLFVPFWIVTVILAIPTALLWWWDRRPPKGHCDQCGYDLTGNVSGVCPECGHAAKTRNRAPGARQFGLSDRKRNER